MKVVMVEYLLVVVENFEIVMHSSGTQKKLATFGVCLYNYSALTRQLMCTLTWYLEKKKPHMAKSKFTIDGAIGGKTRTITLRSLEYHTKKLATFKVFSCNSSAFNKQLMCTFPHYIWRF